MNSDSDSCWIKSPVLIKSANKTSPCRQRASEQTSWWHLILIHVIRASLLNNIQKQAGSKGGHMSKHQNWDLIQICSVSDAFWDLCRGFKWEMIWNFIWILFFGFKREFECFSVTGSWSEVKIWSVWRQTHWRMSNMKPDVSSRLSTRHEAESQTDLRCSVWVGSELCNM